MQCKINLTRKDFNRIYLVEASIVDFPLQNSIGKPFEFTVWGAVLYVGKRWKNDRQFVDGKLWVYDRLFVNGMQYEHDMYLSGIATIRFENLTGVDLLFSPYRDTRNEAGVFEFLKDEKGVNICKHIKIGDIGKHQSNCEYLFECAIVNPNGGCDMKLYSDSAVSMEFDTDCMITNDEFVRDWRKYSYPEDNSIQPVPLLMLH